MASLHDSHYNGFLCLWSLNFDFRSVMPRCKLLSLHEVPDATALHRSAEVMDCDGFLYCFVRNDSLYYLAWIFRNGGQLSVFAFSFAIRTYHYRLFNGKIGIFLGGKPF